MFLFLVSVAGCTASSHALTDRMMGRWVIEKIWKDRTEDVTEEHNPQGNRYFILNKDGSFESGGDPYGKNTGEWTFDTSTKTLYIDSDAGEDDDSYWIVSLNGEQMHWQGTQFDFNSWFEIIYNRGDE